MFIPSSEKLVVENWEEFKVLEKELKKFVSSIENPKIRDAVEYIVFSGGKRIRPLIALVAGRMCGGSYERLMNLAIAGELLHTASLIHDDIIDGAELRRNVIPLHKKYSPAFAIVVGDWLISKAVELTSVYGGEIVRESAIAGLKMCEGEIMDIYSNKEKFEERDYFECIEKKTAYGFAYMAELACRITSRDEIAMERLYDYGFNLGMAYQLVDDLLEYLDALNDKKAHFESMTLPQIYAKKFGEKRGIEKVLELISLFANKSLSALKQFPKCEEREKLEKIVGIMTSEMLEKRLPVLKFPE